MSSSYEYFSTGRYYDLSRLEKLGHEWDLGIGSNRQCEIDVIYINLKFVDMFLSLQSFTTVCYDVTQQIQALFPYAEAEFKRINYPIDVYELSKLKEKILGIKLELGGKYSFPEALLPLSSNVATPEFIKRFIDTVVRNLTDLSEICDRDTRSPLVPCSSGQQMEEVVKQLKLLRNFVYFISDRCTDPQSQHTFFTHVLVVAGHAAMISWLDLPSHWKEEYSASAKMNASFSDLQMRIQPSQPCIRKIYVDVLQALKSGCHPNNQAEHVADYKYGFVETLVHHLEELPITFKDQMPMLNDLRVSLINLPREALKDLDTAIIDAGLLIYSLYDSVEEKEDMAVGELNQVPVLHFSGDIQSNQALIYLITRKSFHFKLPKIDGLGSIDIILDHLKELLSRNSDVLSSIRSQLRTIQQQLEHFQKQHVGFESFAMQMIAKAYEVEHLAVRNKDIPEWCLLLWTGDIIEEITLLIREVAEIYENKLSDLVLHNTTDVASAHTSEFARLTSIREEMVGFQEVMDTLRRQLISGSSHLDVISIVGMPGLGKTFLANKLFFDQLVVSHFDVRAQCCVSQVYTRKDLLLTILRGIKKDTIISDKLPENELADRLRKLLLVQRYLILIDDVWETAAWDDLYPCFCDADTNKRSRIILTTRLGDVASHAKLVSDPHFLRLLTPEESWMLLKDKVFNTRSCPPVLEDVGRKIAQKCGGLPLSVVLVAGILEGMEKEKHCWEQVAINLGSHIQSKSEDLINLSYQDLPFHLKPCFLYFGVFLEDEEIQVSKLTWLWTAEGLVKIHKEKLSEDIAEYYLKNLIGRNLVMVSKKSSDGKTKACRIHDLLLDFCKKKAKEENFLQCIKGDNDNMCPPPISYQKINIPRRLCLHSQGNNLAEWSSICSDVQSFHLMKGTQIASSSIHNASYTFNSFKFLRVLNLEFTVIDSFPEALTCLGYVAVRIADDSSLSFSSNRWNLETLIVKGMGRRVSLPDTLWKMVKLRHLHVYNSAIIPIPIVHEELLKSPPKMNELRTLSSAWFSCVEDANNILVKTPNLQKLRCEVLRCYEYSPAFNNLTKLEVLKFSWGCLGTWATNLKFPSSLKKLTLLNGPVVIPDQVATLPSLVVLKLLNVSIKRKVWEVTDEQFPRLKFLKLQNASFFEWNVSDDAFPCLEHLVIRRLRHLEQIPPRFADMLTLKSIEVISCKESLVESAKDIQEKQVEEMQNCGFKLFIQK
ncbi:putative late blight resistance protein homolog R1B-16 [Solanum dulcamara]|uniref:putative late blight resistance protein homolog R1B-16 n=1 Tax=Solanum dulcamara TaxID=45834 RepID=UPI002485A431|nr:putative late blight resistance protein homolog R1B-16 [Solanum dulcamara]